MKYGEIVAWYGEGYLGLYIVVVPRTEIVSVRQITNFDGYDFENDSFEHYREIVVELVNEL